MTGILFVFHGSQKQEKNTAALSFVKQLQEKFAPKADSRVAFLEKHPATIEKMAQELIQSGHDKLIVVPVLLFAGRHVLTDIPEEVNNVRKANPELVVVQTKTFGAMKGCRDILQERFQSAAQKFPQQKIEGILIAHGTKRSAEPQRDLEEIAAEIAGNVGFPIRALSLKGDVNYIENLKEQPLAGTGIIVPFFLFEGHLITMMQQQLSEVIPNSEYVLTKTLEFDPRILADLAELINEALVCIQ
ncbi:sirohydrochlorin chelatase [Erwinia sp. CPCC 100877]|nr:sirohydrochlorin chelatase [Erwinia sp. CPCC 100877]